MESVARPAALRIALAEPPYAEPIATALARIMPDGVPPLALFRALARNERVFSRVMAGGLLDPGSITLRDREVVIHRTTFRCGSEYEWGVHAAFFAPKARIGTDDLRDLCRNDPAATSLSPHDRLLLRLCDELHDTSTVSDLLWTELTAEWSEPQLIELVVLAGYYHLISFATNALGVPLEPYGVPFAR